MIYAVLALLQKAGKVPRKHSGAISLSGTELAFILDHQAFTVGDPNSIIACAPEAKLNRAPD